MSRTPLLVDHEAVNVGTSSNSKKRKFKTLANPEQDSKKFIDSYLIEPANVEGLSNTPKKKLKASTHPKQNSKKSIHAPLLAADQGDALAQTFLAGCDEKGVGQDLKEAMRLCKLADCYEKGVDVNQDLEESVRLYKLAAQQGYSEAQNNLAVNYFNGLGVAKNAKEAVRLFKLAIQQGHLDAKYNLGVCYENGIGVPLDELQAIHLYDLAAKQGHLEAQYNLARCFEKGIGVLPNMQEAVRLYRLAAQQGHVKAQHNLMPYYDPFFQDEKKAINFMRNMSGGFSEEAYVHSEMSVLIDLIRSYCKPLMNGINYIIKENVILKYEDFFFITNNIEIFNSKAAWLLNKARANGTQRKKTALYANFTNEKGNPKLVEELLILIYKNIGPSLLDNKKFKLREKIYGLVNAGEFREATGKTNFLLGKDILGTIGKLYLRAAPFQTIEQKIPQNQRIFLTTMDETRGLGNSFHCHWLFQQGLQFLIQALHDFHENPESNEYQSAGNYFLTFMEIDINQNSKQSLNIYINSKKYTGAFNEPKKEKKPQFNKSINIDQTDKTIQQIKLNLNELEKRCQRLEKLDFWREFQIPPTRSNTVATGDQEDTNNLRDIILRKVFQLKFEFEIAVGLKKLTEANDLKGMIIKELRSLKRFFYRNNHVTIYHIMFKLKKLNLENNLFSKEEKKKNIINHLEQKPSQPNNENIQNILEFSQNAIKKPCFEKKLKSEYLKIRNQGLPTFEPFSDERYNDYNFDNTVDPYRLLLDDLYYLSPSSQINSKDLVAYLTQITQFDDTDFSPLKTFFAKADLGNIERLLKFLKPQELEECLIIFCKKMLKIDFTFNILHLFFRHKLFNYNEITFKRLIETIRLETLSTFLNPSSRLKGSYAQLAQLLCEDEERLMVYERPKFNCETIKNIIDNDSKYNKPLLKNDDLLFIINSIESHQKYHQSDSPSNQELNALLTFIYKNKLGLLGDSTHNHREKIYSLINASEFHDAGEKESLILGEDILGMIGNDYLKAAPFPTLEQKIFKTQAIFTTTKNNIQYFGSARNCHWLFQQGLQFFIKALSELNENQISDKYESAASFFLSFIGINPDKNTIKSLSSFISKNTANLSNNQEEKEQGLDDSEDISLEDETIQKIKSHLEVLNQRCQRLETLGCWHLFKIPKIFRDTTPGEKLSKIIFQLKFIFEIAVGFDELTEAEISRKAIIENLKSLKAIVYSADYEEISNTLLMIQSLNLSNQQLPLLPVSEMITLKSEEKISENTPSNHSEKSPLVAKINYNVSTLESKETLKKDLGFAHHLLENKHFEDKLKPQYLNIRAIGLSNYKIINIADNPRDLYNSPLSTVINPYRLLIDDLFYLSPSSQVSASDLITYLTQTPELKSHPMSPLSVFFKVGQLDDFKRLLTALEPKHLEECLLILAEKIPGHSDFSPLMTLLDQDAAIHRRVLQHLGLKSFSIIFRQRGLQIRSQISNETNKTLQYYQFAQLLGKLEDGSMLFYCKEIRRIMDDVQYSFLTSKDIVFIIDNIKIFIDENNQRAIPNHLLHELLTFIYKKKGPSLLGETEHHCREKIYHLIGAEEFSGASGRDCLILGEDILGMIGKLYLRAAPLQTPEQTSVKSQNIFLTLKNEIYFLGNTINCHWLFKQALQFLFHTLCQFYGNQESNEYRSAESLFLSYLEIDLEKNTHKSLSMYINSKNSIHRVTEKKEVKNHSINDQKTLSLDDLDDAEDKTVQQIKFKLAELEKRCERLDELVCWHQFQVPETFHNAIAAKQQLNAIFLLKVRFEIAVGLNELIKAENLRSNLTHALRSLIKFSHAEDQLTILDTMIMINELNLRKNQLSVTPEFVSIQTKYKQLIAEFIETLNENPSMVALNLYGKILKISSSCERISILKYFTELFYDKEEELRPLNNQDEPVDIEKFLVIQFKYLAANPDYHWGNPGHTLFSSSSYIPASIQSINQSRNWDNMLAITKTQLNRSTKSFHRSDQTWSYYELILVVDDFIKNKKDSHPHQSLKNTILRLIFEFDHYFNKQIKHSMHNPSIPVVSPKIRSKL